MNYILHPTPPPQTLAVQPDRHVGFVRRVLRPFRKRGIGASHTKEIDHDSASTRLCEICAGLDLRKLLHASDRPQAVREVAYDAWKRNRFAAKDVGSDPGDWPGERYFHRGDDAYYEHLPNMRALVASAESCDLCQAILNSVRDGFNQYPEWPMYITTGREKFPEYLHDSHNNSSTISVFQQGPEDSHGGSVLAKFIICRSDNSLSYADNDLLAYHDISSAERFGLQDLGWPRVKPAISRAFHNSVSIGCAHRGSWKSTKIASALYTTSQRVLHTESWLLQGFGEDELPMTFRDAIKCVRALGIAYLWIDALCIRQDDALDKNTEIFKMGDIYTGSQITIEASGASTVYESFLETNARPEPGVLVKWQDFPVPLYVRLTQPVRIWDDILRSAVHQRAWTLQERILAPRTLSFGTAHVSFECSSGIIDDVYRETQPPEKWHGMSKFEVVESRRDVREHDVKVLISSWRDTVQNYSKRKMTDASDRLPAIGGLAKRLHSAIGGTYVAGLWHSPRSPHGNLARELCWNSMNPSHLSEAVQASTSDESRAHGPEYCAPSWSWASTIGEVRPQYTLGEFTILADVQAVKIISASGDIFGRLTYGHIDMSAPSMSIPDPALQPELDHPAHEISQDLRRWCSSDRASGEYYQHHIAHEGQEFAIIQLLVADKDENNKYEYDALRCMVIESCGDGTWRRLFMHEFPAWTEAQFPTWTEDMADPEFIGLYLELLIQALKRAPWQTRSFRLV
ncbi:hypothetical protein LTR95_006167 [Oleoguttula sp. CCFEE 5521]